MRVKRGIKARRRRNKVLKRAKGFFSAGSRVYNVAAERSDRALAYAYRDRKQKKRSFRALWIQRINAAARLNGTSYSVLMGAIHKAGLDIDRKVLADLAICDANGFARLVKEVVPA